MVEGKKTKDELKDLWNEQHEKYREQFGDEYDEIFWEGYTEYIDGDVCPCCGQHVFTVHNGFERCPICWWMDDAVQASDPDMRGGANVKSLNERRKWWEEKNK